MPLKEWINRVLVLDNASWHKVKSLKGHHFEVFFLPPCSPDFNSLHRFWPRLKADFFGNWIARTGQEHEECISKALDHLMT